MVGFPFDYQSPNKGDTLQHVEYKVGNPMGFYSS